MSDNQVANFDPKAFQNRVKDHIVNTFGAMLPDDQFATLVEEAVKEFFESPKEVFVVDKQFVKPGMNPDHWNSKYTAKVLETPISPLKQLVWNELSVLVKQRLDVYTADSNVTNPVNKLLDELFSIPELGEHQIMTTQRLLMVMAGQMMRQWGQQVGLEVKGSVSSAFINAGMPDIATKIMGG